MSDKLYDLMDWPEIEAVVYSEEYAPREILGPHVTGDGVLVQCFFPGADKVTVKMTKDGREYPMHLNRYFFPVPCHGAISCFHRQYRADHTCSFHFVIIHTEICQIIAPAFLEPADIVGMMHASHLIGFIILHPMIVTRVLFCHFHLCLFPFCPV